MMTVELGWMFTEIGVTVVVEPQLHKNSRPDNTRTKRFMIGLPPKIFSDFMPQLLNPFPIRQPNAWVEYFAEQNPLWGH
jgi:hypothetical protein